MTLTPSQLAWCRMWLRIGGVEIFRLMEANRTTRARA